MCVFLAYPIWLFVAGPQHFTGPAWPANNAFHNDLFSFVVPGPLQRTSLGLQAVGARLAGAGDATEAGGYVGVPVILIAGYLAWRARRTLRMQLAVLLTLVAAVLSLGPFLAVNGHLTRFPLPFWVFDHLPLLDDIIPERINLEVAAGLAAVMAFGLDDLWRARRRHAVPSRRVLATAGIILVAVVVTQLPRWPPNTYYAAQPASVLPAAIKDAIPGGDPVAITYPYASFPSLQPMIWQAEVGFRFRLLGGYAFRPNVDGATIEYPAFIEYPAPMSPPQLQQFLGREEHADAFGQPEPIGPGLVDSAREAIERYHIRMVIVDGSAAGGGQVATLFKQLLGSPSATADHFSIWTRAGT